MQLLNMLLRMAGTPCQNLTTIEAFDQAGKTKQLQGKSTILTLCLSVYFVSVFAAIPSSFQQLLQY